MTRPLLLLTGFGFCALFHSQPAAAAGADASAGYAMGSLLGSWPTPGVQGTVHARYDAFIAEPGEGGPRMSLGFWGNTTLAPAQEAQDSDGSEPFSFKMQHMGIMGSISPDPELPWAGITGIGFGRLQLNPYESGIQVLPTLDFEIGARHHWNTDIFSDLVVRTHWGTSRSPTRSDTLHEWWAVHLLLTLGAHVR